MQGSLWFAFMLTALAGLSTGIGATIAFFAQRTNRSFLSFGLGLSAGVMIYISFVEMLGAARDGLAHSFGARMGNWIAVGGFFAGMLVIGAIDRLIPSYENPHDAKDVHLIEAPPPESLRLHDRKLLRLGVLTALAIGIHNFPEGLATLVTALDNPARGVSVAIAIAIHNIPEGIAIAVPLYFATGSRRKAFTYSFCSGITEPIGAIVGFVLLRAVLNDSLMGVVYAAVAGIMVFISLDQLIPNAHEYSKGHYPIYGLVAGMGIMALTLLMLA